VNKKNQPLSPHLTVYKPQITSIMSISHRISGFFQSIGTILLFIYVLTLFIGEEFYNIINFILGSLLGKTFLFFYFLSICYHFCNGIRHLIWDLGYGFEIKNVYLSGYITILLAILMNLAIWFFK
jgi:succinate dehydrogenase / fumarate reductase cytochrome b subunit